METATKNKRGRPKVFNDPKALFYDYFEHSCIYSDRTLINNLYEGLGMDLIYTVYGELINDEDAENEKIYFLFHSGDRFLKQGVLQQLGRMTKENFTEEELKEATKLSVNLLQEGAKVKEVEARLRKIRIDHKERG